MRQQHKSPVKELSLLPVREDQSPVRVTSKAGKKWQGESNASEKRRKITPSEKVFIQYASQMAMIQNLKDCHRVCKAWVLLRFKIVTMWNGLLLFTWKNDWHYL